MGLLSRLLGVDTFDAAQRVLAEPYEPFISTGGIPVMDPGSPLGHWTKAHVETFWRSQHNVRKVVGFVARNVASIPLHVYERVADNDRQRVADHPLAHAVANPRPGISGYRFWEAVISDGLLYDRWGVLKDFQPDGSVRLVHVPSWRLRLIVDEWRIVTHALMWVGDNTGHVTDGGWIELDLDVLIYDHGYAPSTAGLSPIETLKDILDESTEAVDYRRSVWANGGHASRYIKRPTEAKWTKEQRARFIESMRKFRRDGESAGGTMLLEDGMDMHTVPAPASVDLQDLEGRKLSAQDTASAFYVAPELVGAREGTYSNVDAFRQMTYRDSLGPYITAWEQAINVGLTPDVAGDRDLYVEALVESKLRGSFIEQAQIMQSATGAPYLTRNEARAMQNRPPIEGGDELIVPLNVVAGGQASPQDSGSQNRRSGHVVAADGHVRVKSGRRPDEHEQVAERTVAAFLDRQSRSVRSSIGAGDPEWWDEQRWNRELADVVAAIYLLTATEAGRRTLDGLGIDADEYSEPRTEAFLRASAERSARLINDTTRDSVQAALDGIDHADPDAPSPAEAAGQALDTESSKAGQVAATVVTFAAAFGATEAARQRAPTATKTWQVNSGNPRASHAAMHGETVALDDNFSNGLPWPASIDGPPEETAGCQCSLVVNVP